MDNPENTKTLRFFDQLVNKLQSLDGKEVGSGFQQNGIILAQTTEQAKINEKADDYLKGNRQGEIDNEVVDELVKREIKNALES